jgi:hypothetical protein
MLLLRVVRDFLVHKDGSGIPARSGLAISKLDLPLSFSVYIFLLMVSSKRHFRQRDESGKIVGVSPAAHRLHLNAIKIYYSAL